MKKSVSNQRGVILLVAVMIMSLTGMSSDSEYDHQEPEKAHTEVLGDYEFDLSDLGMGILIITFYAEDGTLWARRESAEEASELMPLDEKEYEFAIEAPDEGRYELKFLPDEAGLHTRCHVKNDFLGIDTVGHKLDKRYAFLRRRLMSRTGLAETRDDLSGTRVALYFGKGMDGHSALALGRAFQWMGCDVETVDAEGIKGDRLRRFAVLAFPGGEKDPNPWEELGLDGKSKIQNFIREGGGYIGICLGALFACDNGTFWGNNWGVDDLYLDIFPGVAHCGQEKIAQKGSWPLMTYLKVSGHSHPITSSLPDRVNIVCYPNGPYLRSYEHSEVAIIATFEVTGNPAMVACEYGKGRVFLSGPHPEIDVTSDRDGSSRFNNLSDEESDWPVLLAVMKWITLH